MRIRKTPLFYISITILMIGLPLGLYGLTLPGWDALIGIFALLLVFGSWVLFALEQLLIRIFKSDGYGLLVIDTGLLVMTVATIMLMLNS